jgi:hypothetical protein
VEQNVIDPLTEGKNYGPRQAIAFLKSIIPSTLPSVEIGEDRQEYSRIVTDMSGQSPDLEMMQTFGGPGAIGMEQVQYQTGELLENPGADQVFEQFHVFDHEVNTDQEVIDVLNQWPPSGMDFSVGFEPFELESYPANITESFGPMLR